jgi:N-acetyl-gamma-glutamyl-phosphate reductase
MSNVETRPQRVAVIGASGYAGGELIRLLVAHPGVELTFLGAGGSAGKTLAEVHPYLGRLALGAATLREIDSAAIAEEADLAFMSLPHGASAMHAPALLEAGLRVIDLAGDFRLPPQEYPKWYGFEHPAPGWCAQAAYGLPELFASAIAGASLVANPGCYPTPVILGLSPLLGAGLIEPSPVSVDGKTGLSGAGRAAVESSLFTSTEDSIRPYRAPLHQHTPEMERGIQLANGSSPRISFVPHLVPTVRGVVTTCYSVASQGASTESLTECLSQAYAGQPFVRVLAAGQMVDSKRTRGSNVVELQAFVDARTGIAVMAGALDNLVKGAAGQAIQNMNLMMGLDPAAFLPTVAVYP